MLAGQAQLESLATLLAGRFGLLLGCRDVAGAAPLARPISQNHHENLQSGLLPAKHAENQLAYVNPDHVARLWPETCLTRGHWFRSTASPYQ